MELTICYYVKTNDFIQARKITFNKGELDEIIENYLNKEYLKNGENLQPGSIEYESVNL